MRNVCLLGATGSIGTQTLDIIRLTDDLCLKAFSFGENIDKAIDIINEFKPSFVCCKKEEDYKKLAKMYEDITFYYGEDGLNSLAQLKIENVIFLNALVGSCGLLPTYYAIKAKKDIYLANKETLVIGGDIIMEEAKNNNVKIIPIDSEHSAIYQLLDSADELEIKNLIITASGGSLRDLRKDELDNVTLDQVLNHPNWKMGKKITVDSATMMNKGFEVIEAHHLFNVSYDKIKVLIHRNSIVHSMVEFNDNSICAQLGSPDMHLPINYAINGKKHVKCDIIEPLDLSKLSTLTFEELDNDRYPLVGVAITSSKKGGIYPCILNASNEAAVELFINGYIKFNDIEKIILDELNNNKYVEYNDHLSIERILEVDKIVKENVKNRKVGK